MCLRCMMCLDATSIILIHSTNYGISSVHSKDLNTKFCITGAEFVGENEEAMIIIELVSDAVACIECLNSSIHNI